MRYIHSNLRVGVLSANNNPGQIAPIRNGAYTYHDLNVRYIFNDTGLEVYFGVDNVFDKDPPVGYFGAGVGDALYDSIGRFMYGGATYKF